MWLDTLIGRECVRCRARRTRRVVHGEAICHTCALEIAALVEPRLGCPVCGVEMAKLITYSLIVDKCPECRGIWLDPGELDRFERDVTSRSRQALDPSFGSWPHS